ncbi:MAG TPA: hypothetical protein DDW52_29820 [Planctomycetaceae bacterium]|nr:hypothetical protein [Planctomycetaceae bacterium]
MLRLGLLVAFLLAQSTVHAARSIGKLPCEQQKKTDLREATEKKVRGIQFDERSLPEKMSKVATRLLTEQRLPGLVVVVVRGGRTIYEQGFGYANVDSKKAVEAEETIFRVGSISKALTLLTLTRQIDLGSVQRSAPVEQWIKSFSNPGGVQAPLTIDHLLTHTGGLDQIGVNRQIRQTHLALEDRRKLRGRLEDFLTANNLRRVNRPGITYRYDTYGTTLAGHILGKVVGTDYARAMQREMFDVLGMTSTSVETQSENIERLATGYIIADGEYQPRPYEFYRTTPASSIDATASDIARLLEALTSDGANASGRLLSKDMLARVYSPHFRVHPDFCGVSHGLFESWTSEDGTADVHMRSLGHGGSMDGYRAALTLIPSQKIGVFVATNRSPSDSGGVVDFRPLVDVVLNSFSGAAQKQAFEVPQPSTECLSEYAGEYFYGMYCHSMTAADQGQGAWLRPPAIAVSHESGGLRVGDEMYVQRGEDLFVEATGRRMLHFSRGEDGKPTSFTYSTSPDTFERANEGYREFPSLAQRIYELAGDGKLDEAMRLFKKERGQASFYLREAEINNAGYALLRAGRTTAAIATFRINTEVFSRSWNAHDSLGEALAEAGKIQEARASYTQSIHLNPNNAAGKQRLQELSK